MPKPPIPDVMSQEITSSPSQDFLRNLDPRAALKQAIADRDEIKVSLEILDDGIERAADQRRVAFRAVDDAIVVLGEARAARAGHLVESFLDETPPGAGIAQAEEKLRAAERARDEAHELEDALQRERGGIELRLDRAGEQVRTVMRAVITGSATYADMMADWSAAYVRLRTLRALYEAIDHICGPVPADLAPFRYDQPIDIRVGYPADMHLIETWEKALFRLSEDADAPIPGDRNER
jgi:hypothetical protein